MDSKQCIPANPDISGIGVRTAIYAQNLLCFLPVILYLWDGEISADELAGIQDQSTGMLAIAFAILITTVSLAAGPKPTVSNYHAAILLHLSWMNNTSTWIWFILFIYERSTAKYKPVGASWSAWCTTLWSPVRSYLHGVDPPGSRDSDATQVEKSDEKKRTWLSTTVKHLWDVCRRVWQSKPMIYLRRFPHLVLAAPVLTLGSIHLSLMAAIGIWLWRDPRMFGKQIDWDRCPSPTLTILGARVPLIFTPLRTFSLATYYVLLIPGLNLLPPFVFFLFLHISYNYICTRIHTAMHVTDGKGKGREVRNV